MVHHDPAHGSQICVYPIREQVHLMTHGEITRQLIINSPLAIVSQDVVGDEGDLHGVITDQGAGLEDCSTRTGGRVADPTSEPDWAERRYDAYRMSIHAIRSQIIGISEYKPPFSTAPNITISAAKGIASRGSLVRKVNSRAARRLRRRMAM